MSKNNNKETKQCTLHSVSGSIWKPTMVLRYKWKEVITPLCEQISASSKQTVLQQRWVNDSGDSEWRDVDVVM